MSEPTISFTYVVHCGDPRNFSLIKSWCPPELAPASLCTESASQYTQELQDSFDALARALAAKHTPEILNSHKWTCIFCRKPTSTLSSHNTNKLYKPTAGSTEAFNPKIIVIAIPVCSLEGLCASEAAEIAGWNETLHQWTGKQIYLPELEHMFCHKCGSSGVKACSRCERAW